MNPAVRISRSQAFCICCLGDGCGASDRAPRLKKIVPLEGEEVSG